MATKYTDADGQQPTKTDKDANRYLEDAEGMKGRVQKSKAPLELRVHHYL